MRGGSEDTTILEASYRTSAEDGERMGYKIIDIVTEKKGHRPQKHRFKVSSSRLWH